MNPVRSLRRRAAVTQRALARAAGTSQPTIAAYESGRKSPTVDTLRRLAQAVGLVATVDYRTPLTREERRSLALHRVIAERLAADPVAIIAMARRTLARMRARHGRDVPLLRDWDDILDSPTPAVQAVLTDQGEWARELRHVTPFAGVLSAAERAALYRQFADDHRHTL